MEEAVDGGKEEEGLGTLEGLNQSFQMEQGKPHQPLQEEEAEEEEEKRSVESGDRLVEDGVNQFIHRDANGNICPSDQQQTENFSAPGTGNKPRKRKSSPRERALDLVALRLRRIGDELDDDIRDGSMTSRRRSPTGRPVGRSNFLAAFPVAPMTSRKHLMAIRDLACETLTRDLARSAVRDVLAVAGRALLPTLLCELISVVTCPVNFRSKWPFAEWSNGSIG